jgi:hypothetical protein
MPFLSSFVAHSLVHRFFSTKTYGLSTRNPSLDSAAARLNDW